MSSIEVWRQLRNENVTQMTYGGFMKWLDRRNVDKKNIASHIDLIRREMVLEKTAKGTNIRASAAKVQLLKAIDAYPGNVIPGRELIDLATRFGSPSRSTLHRRGVRASHQFPRQTAKNIVLGVQNVNAN